MFFILSKILAFLFSPFNWLIVLGISYFIVKRESIKKKIKLVAILVFFLFSYKPLILFFISGWEPEGKLISDIEHYEVGIVLGGGFEYDNDRERLSIRRAGDRVWSAIRLFKLGKIDYILLSGKNGDLVDKGLDESNQLKEILIEFGVPEQKILIDSESLNTFQNAINSKGIIESNGFKSCLLITSALHMKRAHAVFQKQGLECDVFPTDYYSGGYHWTQFIFPSLDSFALWDKYFHEVFGYMVYSLTGKL